MDDLQAWVREISQKLRGLWHRAAADCGTTHVPLLEHGDTVFVEMPEDAEWIPQSLEFDCDVPFTQRYESVRLKLTGWHTGKGNGRTAEFTRV